MESTAFWHLGRLKKIKRLVLDHTQIELATLLVTLQSMEQITHLSIGSFISCDMNPTAFKFIYY